jgi:hypothetical protein
MFTFSYPSPGVGSCFGVWLKSKNAETFLGGKCMEHCKNPWKHVCVSEDIKLYIQVRGENLPICQQCWGQIADQDEVW